MLFYLSESTSDLSRRTPQRPASEGCLLSLSSVTHLPMKDGIESQQLGLSPDCHRNRLNMNLYILFNFETAWFFKCHNQIVTFPHYPFPQLPPPLPPPPHVNLVLVALQWAKHVRHNTNYGKFKLQSYLCLPLLGQYCWWPAISTSSGSWGGGEAAKLGICLHRDTTLIIFFYNKLICIWAFLENPFFDSFWAVSLRSDIDTSKIKIFFEKKKSSQSKLHIHNVICKLFLPSNHDAQGHINLKMKIISEIWA